MARIFITGSADGLGSLTAELLEARGHRVVLHARNEKRAMTALEKVPKAEKVLVADLSSIEEIKQLATEVNSLGQFDACIYNAGINHATSEQIFTVNSLAPYILTSLIHKPKRIVYIGSVMHKSGNVDFANIIQNTNYADSKLQVLLLCKAVARRWPEVNVNTVHPGWVPTKMGGTSAPDDLQKGVQTQVWLATSNDSSAKVTGRYFYHMQEAEYSSKADDSELQEAYIDRCQEISSVALPR
jgi:NAD(P)-dependent dehydrogenase (short-subunit alcohol dehydrogenase family)